MLRLGLNPFLLFNVGMADSEFSRIRLHLVAELVSVRRAGLNQSPTRARCSFRYVAGVMPISFRKSAINCDGSLRPER